MAPHPGWGCARNRVLWIVSHPANTEAYDGRIEVESVAGQGTAFRVTLPRTKTAA